MKEEMKRSQRASRSQADSWLRARSQEVQRVCANRSTQLGAIETMAHSPSTRTARTQGPVQGIFKMLIYEGGKSKSSAEFV